MDSVALTAAVVPSTITMQLVVPYSGTNTRRHTRDKLGYVVVGDWLCWLKGSKKKRVRLRSFSCDCTSRNRKL
jgi:hypothetical protein